MLGPGMRDDDALLLGALRWGGVAGTGGTATSRWLGHVLGRGPAGRRVTIATLPHSETRHLPMCRLGWAPACGTTMRSYCLTGNNTILTHVHTRLGPGMRDDDALLLGALRRGGGWDRWYRNFPVFGPCSWEGPSWASRNHRHLTPL